MDKQQNVEARPGDAERPQESGAASPGRGGRMSRQRKTAAVLRLLRGEDLETVSRSLGVTAATLTGWRDAFLAAGEAALTTRPATGEELESERLKARLGAALIERDLLDEKIAMPGGRPPFGPTEAQAMSRAVSPVSGQPYGLAAVCRVWRLARSGVYRHQAAPRDRHRSAVGRSGRCRMRRCSRRSAPCLPPARSMARAIARSGPGCASPAYGPRCAGCCG